MIDEAGLIRFANASAATALGYGHASDLLGKPSHQSVYFFCAEALTNVVKHARASSAWVEVAADGERCEVEVRDDGIGGAQARSDSSGLTGLRDRIGALNGVMNIVAPADGGTVLHAVIPLPGRSAGEAGLTP